MAKPAPKPISNGEAVALTLFAIQRPKSKKPKQYAHNRKGWRKKK